MSMTIRIILFLCFATTIGYTQSPEGVITYNRKTDWISIMSKLSYIQQEDIDRSQLTWGKNENKGSNYNLFFKNNQTLYTRKEEMNDSGYSWHQDVYIAVRDLKNKKSKDIREEMGRKYLIEEDTPKKKWKILNEIKEIQGYLCMKAETKNEVKDQTIHAWFTDAIPVFGGPEGMGGLPGMILELDINEGDAVITATKIDLTTPIEKLPIPKKMKGKKITSAELDQKLEKYIAQSIEGRKNPFWRIRY